MTSSAECARAVAEDIAISGQVESVVPTAADLLEVAHLLSVLRPLSGLVHHVLLGLELLPLSLWIAGVLLAILKGEHLLGLFVVLLHLLLMEHLLLLLLQESLLLLISLHVAFHVVLLGGLLEGWPVVVFAHVVISLAKSVRGCLLHLLLLHLATAWLALSSSSSIRAGDWSTCSTKDVTSGSVRSLGSVSRVPQALPLLDLLVYVGQRVLQVRVVSVLLLVKWSHTKLLMGESLVLAA